MRALTNENFKDSGLDLELLNRVDGAIYQIQLIYHDIKTKESYNCNDTDVETVGEYILKYPEIFLTAYNHNDKITITITEATWEIDVKDYEDYQNLISEDLEKVEKEVNSFLKEQKTLQ